MIILEGKAGPKRKLIIACYSSSGCLSSTLSFYLFIQVVPSKCRKAKEKPISIASRLFSMDHTIVLM